MFSCRFYLFCVLTILCISLCLGNSHTEKCRKTDTQALLKLKDGFIHGREILSSWNGEDCCKWKGISCNNLTAQVTKLNLLFSYFTPVVDLNYLADSMPTMRLYNIPAALGGKIDSSICELQHLTFLDLSFNYLEGEIPKCIGSLAQLVDLKLARNALVGSIPHTLANLSNLQNLDLRYNYNLVANDLEWLPLLSNLRHLDLSYINLGRAIDWPLSISKIPFLSELYLNDCGLSQVNPKSISNMNSSTFLQILSLSGNNFNPSIMSWVLNVSKVLTILDLSHNELDSSIIKSFQTLCQLKELYLGFNKLSGKLNDYLLELCSAQHDLEVLNFDYNPFNSELLPNFSWFSSLKRLSLQNTSIVGPLSFGHLPHLKALDLSLNHLRGPLPLFEATKFASLHFLDLSHNELNGTLSYTIGQLSNLWFLSLSSNNLNGIIRKEHLLRLPGLKILDVSHNSLSFNLTPNWIPPFQLVALYASSCILGPQFPTWLKYQRKLEVLQISNTSIMDSFPKWFWNISSSLLYLNVSHNKLSGVLPQSSLPSIKAEHVSTWDFSFNILSGPLPSFLPKIRILFLSNNMFSGFVSSFCEMSPMYVTYLDLSSNLLAGPLLNCWEKFQSLLVLNLANNSLSGVIPKSIGTLPQIESLHLNNNNFSGEIPSLNLCRSLRFIDFGDNILEGTLPTLLDLDDLIVLHLQGNKIQGSIPTSLCNLLSLQVLDLSSNNIIGKIPQCLSDISALSDVNSQRGTIFYGTSAPFIFHDSGIGFFVDETILTWKGYKMEFGVNLGFITTIDLSDNHLTGEIPQILTTLVALVSLNLSGNNLTGFIPNNIGDMQRLESVDLSRNHLYGKIPQSFSNLIILGTMNLSFNNLSGEIPISTHLQTFDASSYVGNIGLCGPPLTNQCPADVIPPFGRVHKNGTNELKTFGFYVSLGFGFCVGFWSVCGTLIIKSSWRHAYFRFFNNINAWIFVTVVVFTAKLKRRFEIQTKR